MRMVQAAVVAAALVVLAAPARAQEAYGWVGDEIRGVLDRSGGDPEMQRAFNGRAAGGSHFATNVNVVEHNGKFYYAVKEGDNFVLNVEGKSVKVKQVFTELDVVATKQPLRPFQEIKPGTIDEAWEVTSAVEPKSGLEKQAKQAAKQARVLGREPLITRPSRFYQALDEAGVKAGPMRHSDEVARVWGKSGVVNSIRGRFHGAPAGGAVDDAARKAPFLKRTAEFAGKNKWFRRGGGVVLAGAFVAYDIATGKDWEDAVGDGAGMALTWMAISALDAPLYAAMIAAGPVGWAAAAVYTVAKILVVSGLGDKIGDVIGDGIRAVGNFLGGLFGGGKKEEKKPAPEKHPDRTPEGMKSRVDDLDSSMRAE